MSHLSPSLHNFRAGILLVEENIGGVGGQNSGWVYHGDTTVIIVIPTVGVWVVAVASVVATDATHPMVADDSSQRVGVGLLGLTGQQPPAQVQVGQGEADAGADLAGEMVIMPEPLQVDAQGLGQTSQLRVFESIPQHLTFVATIHVVSLELVSREETLKTVRQGNIRTIKPT